MPEWVNILLRSLLIFALAFALIRLMGKRQAAQLTFFDLVIGIAVGVIAAAISLNLIANMAHGIIALAVWTGLPILIYYLSLKYKVVRDVYKGKETVLINHGKVLEDKLLETRLSAEDLLSQLRKKNIFQFADVEFAILEPDGELSVLPQKAKQPLTPQTIGLTVAQESVPQTVILDGVIMDEPLSALGLNRGWLQNELKKTGVALENVFLAQVDSYSQLYLDLFDDAIQVPKPKVKELLYATLKSCQADCEMHGLSTKNSEAKAMYTQSALELEKAVQELEPLLKR